MRIINASVKMMDTLQFIIWDPLSPLAVVAAYFDEQKRIIIIISPSVNFRQAQVGPTSKVICIKFMGANILQYHYPWINKCV